MDDQTQNISICSRKDANSFIIITQGWITIQNAISWYIRLAYYVYNIVDLQINY